MAWWIFILSLLTISTLGDIQACQKDLNDIINNSPNDFGMLVYYSGRDLNDYGQYYECSKLDYARYVIITLQIDIISVALGICGPKSCEPNDYKENLLSLLNKYPVAQNLVNVDSINVKDPKHESNAPFTTGAITAMIFFGTLVLIIIMGTIIERKSQANPDKRLRGWRSLLVCFSFTANLTKLTAYPEKYDNLQLFNGVRVIAMVSISFGHSFLTALSSPSINPLRAFDIVNGFWHHFVYYALYSVDFFFVMAGFLLAYLSLGELQRRKGRMNWLMFIIHRIIRICPIYFSVYFFFLTLYPLMGSGPGWQVLSNKNNYSCEKYWWSVPLFINNFIPDNRYSCMAWSWFIANDMQFYIFSPVILILHYKNKIYGYCALILLLIVNVVVTVVISSENDYNPGVRYGLFNTDQFLHSYIRPYFRMNSYIIGMMLGFVYKGYKEAIEAVKERTEIEMQPNEELLGSNVSRRHLGKGSIEVMLIGWTRVRFYRIAAYIVGLTLITAVVFGPYNFSNNGVDYWTKGQKLFYIGSEHLFVALGFVFCIVPMIEGHGGWMLSFLTSKYFAVAAKISFSYYLIHPMIILFYIYSHDQSVYIQDLIITYPWVTTVIISTFISIFTTLAIESPMLALEKKVFGR
ncbi:hypothetical protein SteCoe_19856 [Stentor coeruleus]|uniref:Acyltransferase 3 domain-containing protein n=1 Tax=Stentor coeruleus TaxID=5963 RepID=A0A1R2BTS9_9CILI|nr:hypothetical protein SteCoe_19856 [Stentor coeruleus]